MITPAADKAIDQGLAYLANNQNANGSFGTVFHKGNVAITSLAALALMSGGHQPGRGKYGKNVTAALDFMLKQQVNNPKGYIFNQEGIHNGLHGPMYGHGFATLFLGEVYGMAHKKELRAKLKGAVKDAVQLVVKSQNREGGWRYQPNSQDADISVTICQIMALRSARNAGIAVPKSTVDRCTKYVKDCQNEDGGFRYTMQRGQASGFARTAAGVVALYSAGVYKGPAVEKGLDYLMKFKPGTQVDQLNNMGFREMQMHYFYGHYYAVQAMWTAGGKYWKEWYPAIRNELLGRQRDGVWDDRICPHYGTAMACIILQIPNNYLPILQK
jgi:prenyltransferase beta subunit